MINALESLLVGATALMSIGVTFVSSGKVWEGLACVIVAVGLVYYRGTIKQ